MINDSIHFVPGNWFMFFLRVITADWPKAVYWFSISHKELDILSDPGRSDNDCCIYSKVRHQNPVTVLGLTDGCLVIVRWMCRIRFIVRPGTLPDCVIQAGVRQWFVHFHKTSPPEPGPSQVWPMLFSVYYFLMLLFANSRRSDPRRSDRDHTVTGPSRVRPIL